MSVEVAQEEHVWTDFNETLTGIEIEIEMEDLI